MGREILQVGKDIGVRSGLCSYHNASQSSNRTAIMGGGELGDASHFEMALRCVPGPGYLAACGINPIHDFNNISSSLLNRIKHMAYISVRSYGGAECMRSALGRQDVSYAPDLAFSLYSRLPDLTRIRGKDRPKLAINVMAFYLLVRDQRRFCPDFTLLPSLADQSFAAWVPYAGSRFVKYVRHLVQLACADGWQVVNIPFSRVDALFARNILSDLPVKQFAYTDNATRVIQCLAACDKFVALRFHAHIFGLLARVPTISVGYSGKCEVLWRDLGFDQEEQISRLDICIEPILSARRAWLQSGRTLSKDQLKGLSLLARESILNTYQALVDVNAG
jgi:polysaccharide pyruvyl transferase WcaK-like protein